MIVEKIILPEVKHLGSINECQTSVADNIGGRLQLSLPIQSGGVLGEWAVGRWGAVGGGCGFGLFA